ncbi:MAG: hypothetical protein ACTSV6_01580 [Candidatus Heimdallarchaeota archaeon]
MVEKPIIEKKPWGDEVVEVRKAICTNEHAHSISIVRYRDGSIWVFCPYFGYIGSRLGCKIRKAPCRFFKAV